MNLVKYQPTAFLSILVNTERLWPEKFTVAFITEEYFNHIRNYPIVF